MTKQTKALITCLTCRGTGRQELKHDLQVTLDAVRELKTANIHDVARILRWTGQISGINNRLENLRRLNLLSRVKKGRWYFYSPVKTA